MIESSSAVLARDVRSSLASRSTECTVQFLVLIPCHFFTPPFQPSQCEVKCMGAGFSRLWRLLFGGDNKQKVLVGAFSETHSNSRRHRHTKQGEVACWRYSACSWTRWCGQDDDDISACFRRHARGCSNTWQQRGAGTLFLKLTCFGFSVRLRI